MECSNVACYIWWIWPSTWIYSDIWALITQWRIVVKTGKVCDMSKVSKFCIEKAQNLHVSQGELTLIQSRENCTTCNNFCISWLEYKIQKCKFQYAVGLRQITAWLLKKLNSDYYQFETHFYPQKNILVPYASTVFSKGEINRNLWQIGLRNLTIFASVHTELG